jgi:hypothetical protein
VTLFSGLYLGQPRQMKEIAGILGSNANQKQLLRLKVALDLYQ